MGAVTFAEILILLTLGFMLYRLLRPAQRWLEGRILRLLYRLTGKRDRTVINITPGKKPQGEK